MSVALEPFTHVDWYGWAGASKPDDNTEPLIGYMTVDNLPPAPRNESWYEYGEPSATVIVDALGISINFDTPSLYAAVFRRECGFELGQEWAYFLDPIMTYQDLLDLEFLWVQF